MADTATDTIDNTQDDEVQTDTIDDIFDAEPDEGTEQVETSEDESESEESEEDESDDDESDEEDSEDEDAETTAAEGESVPVKALTEERRKRQAAEKRAKDLEAKIKANAPEGENVPDPIDDPEGYAKYVEGKNNLNALRVKVNLSRDIMLDAKDDYVEKEQVFVELAKASPYLVQQMNASPNPAKFAYQTATDYLEVQKMRDPKYQEELEERVREKVLKELGVQPEGKKKSGKKSGLDVPDLSKATAAGKNSDNAEKGTGLDDIMEDSPL